MIKLSKNFMPDVHAGEKFFAFSGNVTNYNTAEISKLQHTPIRDNISAVANDFLHEYEYWTSNSTVKVNFYISGFIVIDNDLNCKTAPLCTYENGTITFYTASSDFADDIAELKQILQTPPKNSSIVNYFIQSADNPSISANEAIFNPINEVFGLDSDGEFKEKIVDAGNFSDVVVTDSTVAAQVDASENRKISDKVQSFANFPAEWLIQPRFFVVNSDKTPASAGNWTLPENESLLTDIHFADNQLAAFNICGSSRADEFNADYLAVDFDNVFDSVTGEWTCLDAKKTYDLLILISGVTYAEKSISGRGLHLFYKPRAGLFPKLTGAKSGIVFSTDVHIKQAPKMEIYYLMTNKYFIPTGNLFNCTKDTPISDNCAALQLILAGKIKKSKPAQIDKSKDFTFSELPPEYDAARCEEFLHLINPADLDYISWLSVVTAARQLPQFISYDRLDVWNMQDAARYDADKNKKIYDSLKDLPSFGIATLHHYAKNYGYVEKDFQSQWFKENPTFDKYRHSAVDDFKEVGEMPLSSDILKKLFDADISDYGNALRLFESCKNKLRYLDDIGKWLSFDGQIWTIKANSSVVFSRAQELIQILDKYSKTPAQKKICAVMRSEKKISAAIRYMRGLHNAVITTDDLDKHPLLLNCQNGVVDLETGLLHPADPSLYLTQIVAAEYRAGYHNDLIERFLADIIPDDSTRAALLRYLGYCLTGIVNAEKALFFSGGGGNGKGTLTSTLLHLLNTYGTTLPINAFVKPSKFDNVGNADSATPALAKLEKMRLVISDEIPQDRQLDLAKFKLLTGGDALPIRRLFQEASTILPTHKMIFSGNYDLGVLNAQDNGFIRRLLRIEFNQYFDDKTADRTLKQRLKSKDSLTGFLACLVQNAFDYLRDGLFESDEMIVARESYLRDNDFISAFIDEYCTADSEGRIKLTDFIDRIRGRYFSVTNQLSDKSLRAMIHKEMTARGFNKVNWHTLMVYKGVKWTQF